MSTYFNYFYILSIHLLNWVVKLSFIVPILAYLAIFLSYNKLKSFPIFSSSPNQILLEKIDRSILGFLPHQIFLSYNSKVLDAIVAIPYLAHFFLPFLFIVYLFLTKKDRDLIIEFIKTWGWVSLIGVIVQIIFPTSPPWFVDCTKQQILCCNKSRTLCMDYNDNLCIVKKNNSLEHEEAAFYRVDDLFGIDFFHSIYAKNTIKHGAFPSLHVAWPSAILVNKGKWISNRFAIVHVIVIWFAAIYTNHHYFIDCFAGFILTMLVHYADKFTSAATLCMKNIKLCRYQHLENHKIDQISVYIQNVF